MSETASFEEVRDGLGGDSAIVIDVRSVAERVDPGRIPGSCHVPCEKRSNLGEGTKIIQIFCCQIHLMDQFR